MGWKDKFIAMFLGNKPKPPEPDVYFYNHEGKPFVPNRDPEWWYIDPRTKTWWCGAASVTGWGSWEANQATIPEVLKGPLAKGTLNATQMPGFKARMASTDPKIRFCLKG